MAQKQFDINEVVAVACAIYRINGNKIVKDNAEKLPTSKQTLISHYEGSTVEVTDADREFGQKCIAQLQHRLLMNQLSGREQSDFIDSLCDIVNREKIGGNKFGLVVWIPRVVEGMFAEDQQKLDVAHLAYTSKYQGKIGEKLTVNFNPIRVKYVHEYGCFRHFGHDGNGNLIGFLNKKELTGTVTGKIKTHAVSKFNNDGKVTYLNYVKEVQ